MRIDKFIADSLNVSRKDAKIYLKKNLIKVNNSIITSDSYQVNETKDIITYKDNQIFYEKYIYLLMHKPANYLCANNDNLHRTVMELVPQEYFVKDLAICGRLDLDTEGLLILTNDGQFVHEVTSPKHNVEKKYYFKYEGTLVDDAIHLLQQGVEIDDYKTKPATLELLSNNEGYLTISEGKFHQVKKMIQKVGGKITYLKRVSIGELVLGDLEIGHVRKLAQFEVSLIKGE